MCTRMVITPYGLDVLSRLRQEYSQERQRKTPTPPLRSILKYRGSEIPPVSLPQRNSRSASVNFRSERPNNVVKIQSRQQKLEGERMTIMRRIRKKMDTSRELNQRYAISFIEMDLGLISPEKTRARFLQNLKDEQDRKYAKAWTWLESRGFYRTKPLSSRLVDVKALD